MAKKKKKTEAQKRKQKKINAELNKFIKEHKTQILTNAKNDLGTDISDAKIISLFKNNFKERMEGRKATLGEAKEQMKKTLHTETFTGIEMIDFENVQIGLKSAGIWEDFRRLNRHQKLDVNKFKRVSPSEKKVRSQFEYSVSSVRTIVIKVIYEDDGSFHWEMDLKI